MFIYYQQREAECTALTDGAVNPDLPALSLDKLARDRQPKAAAALRRIVAFNPVEAGEELPDLLRRDAGAGIRDIDLHDAVMLPGPHGDPTLLGVAPPIVQQLGEDHAQLLAVGHHQR